MKKKEKPRRKAKGKEEERCRHLISSPVIVTARRRESYQAAAAPRVSLVLLQQTLADADGLRRDLDELVVGDEFERGFERVPDRRRQQDRLVLAGGADVGELLGLHRIHHEVVVAAVDADDHAFVERLAGITNMRPRSCSFHRA